MNYLIKTKQITPETQMKAERLINLGYQRLLNYEVMGGGFSWFGDAPANVMLTAYGLLEFSDMAKVYPVDPNLIERTQKWLISKQESDGSWKVGYGTHDVPAQGTVATTAYITWSLLESGYKSKNTDNAIIYIKENSSSITDNYTLGLIANALVANDAKDSFTLGLLEKLNNAKKASGDSTYWTTDSQTLYYGYESSANIETTALISYAFMKAQKYHETVKSALGYIVKMKYPNGTWGSTQATILSIKALLTSLGNNTEDVKADISVFVNGEKAGDIKITPENSDVLQLIDAKELTKEIANKVEIKYSGTANLYYQIVGRHYIPWTEEDKKEKLKTLEIAIEYDKTTLNQNDIVKEYVNVAYLGELPTYMVIVDLGIPPGFSVLTDSLENLKERKVIEKYSLTGSQITIYLGSLMPKQTVHFSYQLQAKYPIKAKTPKSSVYEYYHPQNKAEAKPVEIIVR